MKIARERKSSLLASNAIHHRVDSLTSMVALVAIGGSHVFHNALWLDPVGGLLVSLLVIKAGWTNTVSSLYELADVGIDAEIRQSVRTAAENGLNEALVSRSHATGASELEAAKIVAVQGSKAGQNFLIELQIAVPDSWTVKDSSAAEANVRDSIGATVRGARRVKIRFVPLAFEAATVDIASGTLAIEPDVGGKNSDEETGAENEKEQNAFADEFIAADSVQKKQLEMKNEVHNEKGHSH
jgi:divalent metal cation (Fe/Co/Zn/Cd) transporter